MNVLKNNKKIVFLLLVALVFFSSLATRYFVYRAKGYVSATQNNLIIARNWAQTGQLAFESKDNVFLSSDRIVAEGVPTNLGNKLNFFLYGLIFRYFGFHADWPLYISFILNSLAAVIFFLIAQRLYSLRVGLITAFLSMLAPFSLPSSNTVGSQEWAWFFLAVAILCFLWPKERRWTHLVLGGLFLGLSAAAKNSFFVAFFPFIVVDFWFARADIKRTLWRSVLLATTFCLIVLPVTFIGGNVYLSDVFGLPNTYVESTAVFGHLFPDTYIYNYGRADYLEKLLTEKNRSFGDSFRFWGDSGSFLQEYGVPLSFFKAEIVTRAYSAWIYFKGLFLSLVVFGGALTWFFILLGVWALRERKKKEIILFLGSFVFFWLFLLIALRTSNYVQLSIIAFPVSLAVAVGLDKLATIISASGLLSKLPAPKIELAVIALFILFFAQISWWDIRELSLGFDTVKNTIATIKSQSWPCQADKQGVVMVDNRAGYLSYYANCSEIKLSALTIKNLADQNKLDSVLRQYGVVAYFGYDEATLEILRREAKNLEEYKIN